MAQSMHIRLIACSILLLSLVTNIGYASEKDGTVDGYGVFTFNHRIPDVDSDGDPLILYPFHAGFVGALTPSDLAAPPDSERAARNVQVVTFGDYQTFLWTKTIKQNLDAGMVAGDLSVYTDMDLNVKGVEIDFKPDIYQAQDIYSWDARMKEIRTILLNKYADKTIRHDEFYFGIDSSRQPGKDMTGNLKIQDDLGNTIDVEYQSGLIQLIYMEASFFKVYSAKMDSMKQGLKNSL